MKTLPRSWSVVIPVAAALLIGLPTVNAASLYLSAVAETFAPNATAATPSQPVTYALIDGGYIEAGDPIGGVKPPSAAMVSTALQQALATQGYQPAPAGTLPRFVLVYHWGEIRHDSMQVQPPNRLKGNDRARLLLVSPTRAAERIEQGLVTDRYTHLKVAAMTRTERERDTLQLASDERDFIVISAYDTAALQRREPLLVWQVRLSTRAVGQSMADALTSLIQHGSRFFGRNTPEREDLKEKLVSAPASPAVATAPATSIPPGIDPGFFQGLVAAEHAKWSGRFPND